MPPRLKSSTDLRLEPGDILGQRFEVTEHRGDDPVWPYRANDLESPSRTVQLAVRALGLWGPDIDAMDTWPAPVNRPSNDPNGSQDVGSSALNGDGAGTPGPACDPPCGVVAVECSPRLRHGGGLILAAAIPDLPVCPPLESGEGDPPSCPLSAETQLAAIKALRRMHRMTEPIEQLHRSGEGHGGLTAESFRFDPSTGQVFIRPVPALSEDEVSVERCQAEDIRALQRMVATIAHPKGIPGRRRSCALAVGSDQTMQRLVRAALRGVLRRPATPSTSRISGIAAWRGLLHQLIHTAEASVLNDESKAHRRLTVSALLIGRFDDAIDLAGVRNDPWCAEIAAGLDDRRKSRHAEHHQWCEEHRDLPLAEAADRLVALRGGGFALRSTPEEERLHQRLAGCIPHLCEAASCLQAQAWARAFNALSVAASLDPANPVLAGLSAVAAQCSRQDQE